MQHIASYGEMMKSHVMNDFEQLKEEMRCSQRFYNIVYPAVAFYDSECSTIYVVLLALESAVSKNYKMILFVRNCDDKLLKTLHMNCLRGTFKCALVCIAYVN